MRQIGRSALSRIGGIARAVSPACVLVAAATAWQPAAEATQILAGAALFSEPDGGVASPGFGGTLAYELFDSGGGNSALAGGAAAPVVGTDYTLIFRIQLDPDTDNSTALERVSMAAFQLGSGDGTILVSPGPTSGGTIGSAIPVYSLGTFGQFADYSFVDLPGGGLAEGDDSSPFFFTIPNVDLGPSGSMFIPEGDQFTVSFIGTAANSVDIQVPLEQPTVIPEPASVWMFAAGFAMLVFGSRLVPGFRLRSARGSPTRSGSV